MRAAKQYHNGTLVQPAWATTLDLEEWVDDYTSGARRSPPALDGRALTLNRDDYCQRNAMSTVTAKIKEEFLAMLPPTIFFFVALHIVSLIRSLVLRGTGLAPMTTISVTVAALILGKAVLIADMLPIINRYPDKPLIYNVAWKTLIYLFVSGVIHYLECLIDFAREAGGLVAGNEKLLAEMVWPHFWAIQIVLLVLISMYVTMHELARAMGGDKLRQMFFGPLPARGF
jgi:hypothetical protein